jgi:helicase
MHKIEMILEKMINLLKEFEFLESGVKQNEFVSASELDDDKLKPTLLGRRCSELYIDPLTANYFVNCLKGTSKAKTIALLHMMSRAGEMRPLPKVKTREYDEIEKKMLSEMENLLEPEPMIDDDYYFFMNSFKLALMLEEWISEKDEEYIMENYDIRPGELRAKLENADWLVYSCVELCKVMNLREITNDLIKLRIRLRNGIKEELLPLIRLKGIGRVRARKMFNNGIKDIGDVKKIDVNKLSVLIGKAVAISVKEQVGMKVKEEEISETEDKQGQQSIYDFEDKKEL